MNSSDISQLGKARPALDRIPPSRPIPSGPPVVDLDHGEPSVHPHRPPSRKPVLISSVRPPMHPKHNRLRPIPGIVRLGDQRMNIPTRPRHKSISQHNRPRRLGPSRLQQNPIDPIRPQRPHHGRFSTGRPRILDGPIRPHRSTANSPHQSIHSGQLPSGEVIAMQRIPRLMRMHHKQRGPIRIPIGSHLTRQPKIDFGLRITQHVPHQKLGLPPPLMSDQQPPIPSHRREPKRIKPLTCPIPLLGDNMPISRVQHPQRRVPTVPMLRMRDRQQPLVPRQGANPSIVLARIDNLSVAISPGQPDRRPVVGSHPHRGDPMPDLQPRRIPRMRPRRSGFGSALGKRLPHPTPELVPAGVVEPPDVLAIRADSPVRSPLIPPSHLAMAVRNTIPGIDLPNPRRVGEVNVPIRSVQLPRRQRDPESSEPRPPLSFERRIREQRLLLLRLGVFTHEAILPPPKGVRGRIPRPGAWGLGPQT